MELSCSNNKKLLYFLEKIFSYIFQNGALSKKTKNQPRNSFLIFKEMEISDSNIKKILIFPEMKPCTFQPKLKT